MTLFLFAQIFAHFFVVFTVLNVSICYFHNQNYHSMFIVIYVKGLHIYKLFQEINVPTKTTLFVGTFYYK